MSAKIDISPEQLDIVQAILRAHLPKGTLAWAFGSRVTWTAKPYSDLDLAIEAATPIPLGIMGDLQEAFENSDLPWRVDVIDLKSISPEFRAIVERQRVPADWQYSRVGNIFSLENGYAFKSSEFQTTGVPVIKIKNVKAGYFSEHSLDYVSRDFLRLRPTKVATENDLLISMSGNRHDGSPETWVGKVAFFRSKTSYLINQRVGALRLHPNVDANPRFFSYLLSSQPYQELFISIATSSGGQANLSPNQIYSAEVLVPPLDEQNEIERTLSALDDKIELNRQMNQTLEALARAVFEDWFVAFGPTRRKMAGETDPATILGGLLPPETAAPLAPLFPDQLGPDGLPLGWEEKPLDEVAEFLNGLALQKFPAKLGEPSLPVIKIAELRNGVSARSDRASRDLADKYIIQNGDFIFSWSGSLMAKFWTEGEGALNQHLFKVSSQDYPTWFFSRWVHHHLDEFQRIAASKATTMGHIQRGHMKAAMTVDPGAPALEIMGKVMGPLLRAAIENDLENQTLAATRDLLLPKLMSGELRLVGGEGGV